MDHEVLGSKVQKIQVNQVILRSMDLNMSNTDEQEIKGSEN